MAGVPRSKTERENLEWWGKKLTKMDNRTFRVPEWTRRVIDQLLATKGGKVRADSIKDLGTKLGVPLKFVPRAVVSAERLGIVSATYDSDGVLVSIHRDRLSRRKIAIDRIRKSLSVSERDAIKAADKFRCACCGVVYPPERLVLDHLIPFSLRGADAPANLVSMYKAHNLKKWDRMIRDDIKFYRGERIRGRLGARFRDGAFWPVVNGKLRREKPALDPAPDDVRV